MNSSSSIVCFGELLIDMISTTVGDLQESEGFLKKFGGAPANTAAGLAKLGLSVYFMGKVGNDPFGHFLKSTLDEVGVKTARLLMGDAEKTTLAFVSLGAKGERDFTFYKGAHENIDPSEVSLPDDTYLFHFGSLTQISEQAKAATDSLIQQAKAKQCVITYDPNVREPLWIDLQKARSVILEASKQVDVLKVNEEEAFLLSNTTTIEEASKKIFSDNLDALFITLGEAGSYYKTKKHEGYTKTIKVNPIDTTGAGDAFNAGYISSLVKTKTRFSDMSENDFIAVVKRANVIAALTTTKKGAITAFPDQSDIEKGLTQ